MKRFIFIVCLMSMITCPSRGVAQNFFVDVNCDGEVNIADINAVIDFILRGETSNLIDMSKSYLSARDFGAVGDGVTDDTDALENLFETAYMLKKAVFFDAGTYLIRRSLTLRTGMEVYGDGAVITKKSAVTTKLMAEALKDQTFVDVLNTEGFNVGDQFVIADDAGANWCTYGIITAIDGNRIFFTNIISDHQSAFPGCVRAYPVGLKVSTSFALLRSWTARFDCDGVSIHDLTLDGNRNSVEPRVWANSCIHLDSYYKGGYTGNSGIEYRTVQRNLKAHDLIIKNSPCDAISDQGEGGLFVSDCVIENSAMHGIHMGTVFSGAVISNNKMTGNGDIGSGVFFCQDVTNVVIDKNQISSFNHGCSDEEFGNTGKFITVRNNLFRDIKGSVFDFLKSTSARRGGGLQVCNNMIEGLNAPMFDGAYLDNVVISDNAVKSSPEFSEVIVKIVNSNNVIISGNSVPGVASGSHCVDSNSTSNLIDNLNSWN